MREEHLSASAKATVMSTIHTGRRGLQLVGPSGKAGEKIGARSDREALIGLLYQPKALTPTIQSGWAHQDTTQPAYNNNNGT